MAVRVRTCGGYMSDLRRVADTTFWWVRAARKEPEKLVQFGWGPPRDPRALTAPGEVRMFRTLAEGDTWIDLTWKAPLGGGAPDAYVVERRDGPRAKWKAVKTVIDTEHRLVDQPRGITFRPFACLTP